MSAHEASPLLVVLDLAGAWRSWRRGARPVAVREAGLAAGTAPWRVRVRILRAGPVASCDALLVIVPAKGLDRWQAAWVRSAPIDPADRMFAAALGPQDLAIGARNEPGYLALAREIAQEYGAPLATLPASLQQEHVGLMLQLARLRAAAAARRHRPAGATGAGEAWGAPAGSDDAGRAWRSLAERLQRECAALVRANGPLDGELAEVLVRGLGDAVEALLNELADWPQAPFGGLERWVQEARGMARPEILLPVVGVFSSGKTTLFNHLLQKTPGGHPPLRTSNTHNTAMLCCFHRREQGPARVDLTFREHLHVELLLPAKVEWLAVEAPEAGTVTSVTRHDSGTWVRWRTPAGEERSVFVARDKRLVVGVKPGARLIAGQALSEGLRLDQHPEQVSHLQVRLHTVAAVAELLRHGYLQDVELVLTWRRRDRERYQFEIEAVSSRQALQELMRRLDALAVLGGEGRPPRPAAELPESVQVPVPNDQEVLLKAEVSGRVMPQTLPRTHPLETDADWDWFQGKHLDPSRVENRKVGFSETIEAAFLVERADLYLDSPLFRLLTLADTPGLNSISEMHDRVTEELIHQGQVFLLLCSLERDVYAESTSRLLDMMRQSLLEQRLGADRHADHIFIVLNYFRNSRFSGAVAVAKRIEEIRRLVLRKLGFARLYAVDLGAVGGGQELPRELLGLPSLACLIDDLKGFLAGEDLARRFVNLERQLEQVWSGRLAALAKDREQLAAAGDSAARAPLEALQRDLVHDGAVRRELLEAVRRDGDDLMREAQTLRSTLGAAASREDFVRLADSGPQQMRRFNLVRNRFLRQLPDDLQATLQTRLRGRLSEVPRISAASGGETIAPLSDRSFAAAVERVVAAWPEGPGGFFTRVWNAIKNLELHGTSQRRKLVEEFLPAAAMATLRQQVDRRRGALDEQIHAACDACLGQVRTQLADLTASQQRQRSRQAELAEAQAAMSRFEPYYLQMRLLLQQQIRHLRALSTTPLEAEQDRIGSRR